MDRLLLRKIEQISQIPARDSEGRSASLASDGRPTVYMFVSPYCGVSRDRITEWSGWADQITESGLRVLLLGWDDEPASEVLDFVRAAGFAADLRLVPYLAVEKLLGTATTPAVVLSDEYGRVTEIGLGRFEAEVVIGQLLSSTVARQLESLGVGHAAR